MFIRFAQLQRDPDARVAPGLFQALNHLPATEGPDWRRSEIARTYDWFTENLDRPDVLAARFSRYGPRRGVCWFHDTATDHIEQARYLAWLLTDIGLPIRELRAHAPGQTIWQDAAQAVIIPEPGARVRSL